MESPRPCNKRSRTSTPESLEMEYDPIPDADGPDDDHAPELSAPRLYHMVARYDQFWDYKEICEKFFIKTLPYLAVKEHQNLPNTHVHFQGYSRLTPASFAKKRARLTKTHHIWKENHKSRPVSMHSREPDVLGFQYMAKELRQPLAVNGFTKEELNALKERSVTHVKALKTAVIDHISTITKEFMTKMLRDYKDPATFINRLGHWLFLEQEAGKIELPPYNPRHSRTSIIRGIIAHPDVPVRINDELSHQPSCN